MDTHRIKKKRKRQKPLVSIVDPWDVKVASVEPTDLASRRAFGSLDKLEIAAPAALRPISPLLSTSSSSTFNSPLPSRTPWPWYKPTKPSVYSASSPADDRLGALASADVPIKLSRANYDDQQQQQQQQQQQKVPTFSVIPDDKPSRDDESQENKATVLDLTGASVGCSEKASSDEQANDDVSLVEQLVRARYSSTPLVQRKAGFKRRPLIPASVNQTETDDSQKLLSNNDQPMKNIIIVGKTRQDSNRENREERPIGNRSRRLSISVPSKLDDMDRLQIQSNEKSGSPKFRRRESDSSATFSNSGSTLNGSTLASDTEDEGIEEESSAKMPLQPNPRQAVNISSSSRNLSNDHMDYTNVQSTNSTITSVNSISSLLKEKLQWSIPQALRSSKKRQNADYRLRGFVGFLFLCIIFLVGFAHVYYSQHVLQRAYFDKFRFNKNERSMHVYNSFGMEILAARLGVDIASGTGVFSCLPEYQQPGKFCLEWLGHSRLYLGHARREAANCYQVTWQALAEGVEPRDCFDWSARRGHWYGAGQLQGLAYPLEQGQLEPARPFITGDVRRHGFGNVLKRYFLNSRAATISVDPETPLYVSIGARRWASTSPIQLPPRHHMSAAANTELCLSAKHDGFAYVNHAAANGGLPQLNYTICAADNMRSLHASMAEKFLWDGLRPDELAAVHALLSEPVWQISPASEAEVYNYTEDVIALGFLRQGHVLLSEQWQPSSGDFVLDEARFRSMRETIDVIHRRGFRIVFTLQPFISTESANFREAVAAGLLISERGSDPRIPALTRYRGASSAGVLDVTNNRSLPWLRAKLEALVERYHVDAFYLDLGTAHDMPHYYRCERPLLNPDHYKSLFVESLLGVVPIVGVSGAISRPRAPVFVSLPAFPSSWKAIKTVIPTVLSYGVAGYPFLMPGAVGGDLALPVADGNPDSGDLELSLPDRELYIRWLQLATFLPVIRFTHLPSKYADESVLEIAKSLTSLRQKTVTPLLKKYANVTLDTGLPIIRPLWMLDPADPACHLVLDEFSVGEELIVAPILHSGSRQREVYLPAGVWKDGIDKSLRKGSRWIHNYRVAEDKVAYFVKMPDDMRF